MTRIRYRDPNPPSDGPELPVRHEHRAALDLPWTAHERVGVEHLAADVFAFESGVTWCAEHRLSHAWVRDGATIWSATSNTLAKGCPDGQGIPSTFVPEPGTATALAVGLVALIVLRSVRSQKIGRRGIRLGNADGLAE